MKLERNDNYTFKLMIESGDAEYPGCVLQLAAFGWRFTCDLPPIIKPDILKVRGQWNYDELIERRYGVYLFENHLNVCYGRGDANFHREEFGKEQRWSCFLPWSEWRLIQHSLFDANGLHFYSDNGRNWDVFHKKEEEVSKAVFRFKDFDGDELEAITHVDEMRWLRGVGWFKWFGFFWPTKIHHSLCIKFNRETGRRKGSYKGGTIGHSIEMVYGDTHESAFRRYCQQHEMTYIGLKKEAVSSCVS